MHSPEAVTCSQPVATGAASVVGAGLVVGGVVSARSCVAGDRGRRGRRRSATVGGVVEAVDDDDDDESSLHAAKHTEQHDGDGGDTPHSDMTASSDSFRVATT